MGNSMTIRIGFTGTQRGMSADQADAVRNMLQLARSVSKVEFHHGDCIGADAEAHAIALAAGCDVVIHPPDVDVKRAYCQGAAKVHEPRPYLKRNHDIVDAVQLMIGAPGEDTEQLRSGTWATMRYAKKAIDGGASKVLYRLMR